MSRQDVTPIHQSCREADVLLEWRQCPPPPPRNIFTYRWYRFGNIVSRKWFASSILRSNARIKLNKIVGFKHRVYTFPLLQLNSIPKCSNFLLDKKFCDFSIGTAWLQIYVLPCFLTFDRTYLPFRFSRQVFHDSKFPCVSLLIHD